VARGWKPGVYTDWGQAERKVNGFSGALHKKFKTRVEAQCFVDKYKVQGRDESEEESEGPGTDTDDASSDEEKPRKRDEPSRKTGDHGQGSGDTESKLFPPLEIAAPDPSTGNAKEFFRMTMAGKEQMAAKMSPPGLNHQTMQELANATLDAIQLPGTSTMEMQDGTRELVGALRDMAEDR
jgi:hypothetical protein